MRRVRLTLPGLVALLAAWGAWGAIGCAAPVGVVREPTLTLRRDRYVLPPEPEPPQPRTLEEQRALEAEWPPVSLIPDAPSPPDGPLRVRGSGCGPVITRCGAEWSGARSVQVGAGGDGGWVRVHVVPSRYRAAPELVRAVTLSR